MALTRFNNMLLAFVATAIATGLPGCKDRDREMAQRKGDGSETFKFQRPPANNSAAPNADRKPPPVRTRESDGTDTFVFKPDPRINPKPATK